MPEHQKDEAATSDLLALETLGVAALVSNPNSGRRAVVFGPSKPLALLVYLASIPGGSATREFLIDLLWADLDPSAARHAFRQTLWYIKQKTGRPLIRTAGDTITLAEPLPSDREAFLHAIEAHNFEAAVSRYAGDFIPDFAIPGGGEFEHWADLERQRLRDTFGRAAEQVARHYLSVARHRDAVALARRVRDTAPLNEHGWRLTLEALISANESLGAALEADALQQMLADDQREPEPATRAMLRTVRQLANEPNAEGATANALVAELVGRELEFSTLLAAWDEARQGTPRFVAVTGPAGIGKTRLIGDIVARLRAKRSRVIWVRANPGERDIAYALLSKLAAGLAELPGAAAVSPATASTLVGLNPTLSASFNVTPDRSDGAEALRRRTIAVHELLAATADEAAVAVVVDDLHWADSESARVLTGVADRLESEPVLLVTAARPSGPAAQSSGRNATAVRLQPLTSSDLGALLTSIATLPDLPVSERLPSLLCAVTDCIPLFVLETLQLLIEQDLLAIAREHWVITDETRLLAALEAGGALRRRIDALDGVEQRVLQAMAVAGVPVPAGFLSDAANVGLADAAAILHALEIRGMVGHVSDGWTPVHDQIAELTVDGMSGEALTETERAVARAWMHSGSSEQALRRAGLHYLRAGDESAAIDTFVKWVRIQRQSGDRRAPRALAREFIDREDAAQMQRFARALPLHYRMAATRWRIAATILFVALASAATTWQWTRQPAPQPDEEFLAVTVDSAGDTSAYRVPIFAQRWQGGDLLELLREGRRASTHLPSSLAGYTVDASGTSWISDTAAPDSGGDELMIEAMTGGRKRLTFSRGDDIAPDLAPDGSRLVFLSGRFDSLTHTHVAIMDLATGRVRQLTSGTAKDASPKWSPDGLLIAFSRSSFTDAPDSLCTMAPDGSHERCMPTHGIAMARGWIDGDRLLYSQASDSMTTLNILDLHDWASRRIYRTGLGNFALSPDGRWVSCQCREAGALHSETILFPLAHPEDSREVVVSPLERRPVWVLWPTRRPRAYVASLDVFVPHGGLQLGEAYRLPLYGRTEDGRRVDLPFATITSRDTRMLRVLPGNRVLPLVAGSTTVIVSANGWRTDTIRLRLVAGRDSTMLTEGWSSGIDRHFIPFGNPRPQTVRDSSGRLAFWNKGDGDYPSGAYTRSRFDASEGAGIEADISTKITGLLQWQTQTLALDPIRDSVALARWDHTTGYVPFEGGQTTGLCGFSYPSDEGTRSLRTLSAAQTTLDPDTIFNRSLRDGRWYRVRVQLFSDGRCGVAIDGRPIALSPVGPPPTDPYVAALEGSSVETKILVGPVEVWTGVKPGVDWLAFDTAHVSPPPRKH